MRFARAERTRSCSDNASLLSPTTCRFFPRGAYSWPYNELAIQSCATTGRRAQQLPARITPCQQARHQKIGPTVIHLGRLQTPWRFAPVARRLSAEEADRIASQAPLCPNQGLVRDNRLVCVPTGLAQRELETVLRGRKMGKLPLRSSHNQISHLQSRCTHRQNRATVRTAATTGQGTSSRPPGESLSSSVSSPSSRQSPSAIHASPKSCARSSRTPRRCTNTGFSSDGSS